MIPLADEENKSYEQQEVRHICKKKFCLDKNDEDEDDENEDDENGNDGNVKVDKKLIKISKN